MCSGGGATLRRTGISIPSVYNSPFTCWWCRHDRRAEVHDLPAACSASASGGSPSRRPRARASTGWVQNLPDGRVEVLAEGEAEAVERFERAVRRGPGSARVDVGGDGHPRTDGPLPRLLEPGLTKDITWTRLKAQIRTVPDFPKPGILFYDITTLLRRPGGLQDHDRRARRARTGTRGSRSSSASRAAASSSAAAVADRLGAGFCPIRKPGKLPAKTISESFSLEYGTDAIEIHEDAIEKGQRVLIVDDVLATGGHGARGRATRQAPGRRPARPGVPHRAGRPQRARPKLEGEQVFSVLKY